MRSRVKREKETGDPQPPLRQRGSRELVNSRSCGANPPRGFVGCCLGRMGARIKDPRGGAGRRRPAAATGCGPRLDYPCVFSRAILGSSLAWALKNWRRTPVPFGPVLFGYSCVLPSYSVDQMRIYVPISVLFILLGRD